MATNYSFALQGAGIAIVVAVSVAGVLLPVVLPERPASRAAQLGLLAIKGCAVGIVLATAFVHLIAESQEYMEELGWLSNFSALPVALALTGILFMAGFDLVPGGHSHGHGHTHSDAATGGTSDDKACESANYRMDPVELEICDESNSDALRSASLADDDRVDQGLRVSTVVLMEASVLSHSLLVGYTLGLLPVDNWTTLVIAIAFHQFFEGIALGQAMRGVKFAFKKCVCVALAFSLITGLGIALGMTTIAVTGNSTMSPTIMAVVAVLEAFCGGLLCYVAFALWFGWFVNANHSASAADRVVSFVGLTVGLTIMVVIGIWA